MASKKFKRHHLGRAWCEAIELDDGRRMILRPMQPNDADMLRQSFAHLTPEEVRMRFMHPIRELTPSHAERLATIDPSREIALLLVDARNPSEAMIGAVGRAALSENGTSRAEFALIVGSHLSGLGLGRHLLGKLVDWARKKRLAYIYGFVLPDNAAMLGLARSMGFRVLRSETSSEVLEVRLDLQR